MICQNVLSCLDTDNLSILWNIQVPSIIFNRITVNWKLIFCKYSGYFPVILYYEENYKNNQKK